MLVLLKLLMEPLKMTWALVAFGPSTALKLPPPPLLSWPVLFLIEKMPVFPASPPQVRPSEALPQPFWLARWKVSCARVVPGDGVGVGGTVAVFVGVLVGVFVGVLPIVGVGGGTFVWVATASLLANS